MRARRHPGVAASAARTSAIKGASASAGGSRSLPAAANVSTRSSTFSQPSAGSDAVVEYGPVRLRKTAGVETASPGLTSTSPSAGNTGAGVTLTPISDMIDASRSRHTGTSAPRSFAMVSSTSAPRSIAQTRDSRRKVAAESADPPPRPEATGKFFSSTIRPEGFMPAWKASERAARRTRFSESSPNSAANGPVTERVRLSACSTLTQSPTLAKTTRLSSR